MGKLEKEHPKWEGNIKKEGIYVYANPASTGVVNMNYYLDDPYTFVGWSGAADDVDLAVGVE